MLYRTVPKTGEKISILGFGAMRLPQVKDKIDEDASTRLIHYSIDRGIDYIDTAWAYHNGASEPFLGKALAGGYREKVNLATKLPQWLVRSRRDMDYYLALQLERLKTERIDYYLIHSLDGPSWDRMKALGITGFLDSAKHDGRIINRGFSFHGNKEDFKRIVDDYDWEFCQIQYNYLDKHNQAGTEGLEYAASKKLGVIVMEPLRGGNLCGKLPEQVAALWDRAQVKRTPAEWALRWIWNRPEVTLILSGMNEQSQVDENIKIASEAHPGSLSASELQLVSQVADTYRSLMRIGCTGCQYCMPCPADVDIQGCFEMYNNAHMFGGKKFLRFFYMVRTGGPLSGKASNASLCVECGKCLEKCPQNLAIPTLLKEVEGEFEGFWFKPAGWLLKRVVRAKAWWRKMKHRLGR
jgi:predicted aldo/keto reductase-like oxidoreductase